MVVADVLKANDVDGMIENVSIETISGVSYLVIDFNTASGKEDIQIPLTDIFDPSNYYTKAQIDAKGYLTSYTETDPTVPAWAKAASKPSYTAAEVGALPATTKIPTIHTGTTEPSSTLGNNGDIYIMKF